MPTRYEWLFGQCPLVVEDEHGPIQTGDSDWIVDLLGMDLTRRHARVMAFEDLDILDGVEPLIRLAYTHDQSTVRLFDMLVTTRVGKGTLTVSSLDHHAPVGRFLLSRIIASEVTATRASSPTTWRAIAAAAVSSAPSRHDRDR